MEDDKFERRVEEIRRILEPRETEDLVEVWTRNDQKAWTPEAFEAIGGILQERLGRRPLQGDLAASGGASQPIPEEEDEVEEDTYYSFKRMTNIAFQAKNIVWIGAVAIVVQVVGAFLFNFLPDVDNQVFWRILNAIMSVTVGVVTLLYTLILLRAISEALYLFADIEDNTRRVAVLLERRVTLDQDVTKL